MELLELPVRWQQMSAVACPRYEEKYSSEVPAPRWFGAILVECAARRDGAVVAEAA
jgi:hypothetical protein